MHVWQALIRSRKFRVAVMGIVSLALAALAGEGLAVDQLMDNIGIIVSVLIAAIAAEDMASKVKRG